VIDRSTEALLDDVYIAVIIQNLVEWWKYFIIFVFCSDEVD
jgi:hypothetical protein